MGIVARTHRKQRISLLVMVILMIWLVRRAFEVLRQGVFDEESKVWILDKPDDLRVEFSLRRKYFRHIIRLMGREEPERIIKELEDRFLKRELVSVLSSKPEVYCTGH